MGVWSATLGSWVKLPRRLDPMGSSRARRHSRLACQQPVTPDITAGQGHAVVLAQLQCLVVVPAQTQ